MALYMPCSHAQNIQASITQNTTRHCHLQSTIRHQNDPIFIIWSFSPSGFVKINTEGSFMPNSRLAGFGGVTRDNKGRWLGGFYGRLNMKATSSLTPELWAIHAALTLVKNCNLKKMIIETDSNDALMLLSRVRDVAENRPDHDVIKECRILLSEVETSLVHTFRQYNNCADHLAKFGRKQNQNFVTLHHSPPSMHQLLIADMANVAYARYQKHAR